MSLEKKTSTFEIRVLAARRSGHHAIIEWIAHHFKGPVLFLNDCRFNFYDLKAEREPDAIYFNKNQPSTWGEDFDCFIYNFEDGKVEDLDKFDYLIKSRFNNCYSDRIFNVIIVRDLFNWVASRIKGTLCLPGFSFKVNENEINIWKGHVKECLGDTVILKTGKSLPIKYNDWFCSPGERKIISHKLELKHIYNKGMNHVSCFGKGSSFNDFEYEGAASNMDVLYRWREFENNSRFWKTVSENDLLDLSIRMFGFYFKKNGNKIEKIYNTI